MARHRMYDYQDDDPWLYGPETATTAEAAWLCHVSPATIRQWAARGYLTATGTQGRSNLYLKEDLRLVLEDVEGRTAPKPQEYFRHPIGPRRAIPAREMDKLVTTGQAAQLAGVATSTIRMWVLRGHLTAAVPGPRPLHRIGDVLLTARRKTQTTRKPK